MSENKIKMEKCEQKLCPKMLQKSLEQNSENNKNCEFDLLSRTSWTDAVTAYKLIKKDKADGNVASLWVRCRLQTQLFNTGCSIQRNAGKILFVGILILATFCVGLKSTYLEYDLEKLWVEEGGRVTRELQYIRSKLGVSTAGSDQIIIQTPGKGANSNILRPEALLMHADILREALDVEVDLYDITWSLKDLCIKPNAPTFDHHFIDQIFENILPCTVITPLDCFWEGAKILGPKFPPSLGEFRMENLTWTKLNPPVLIEEMKKQYKDVFPFAILEKFMDRAGIHSGYQEKPCLNPLDPECPDTAPNKNGSIPDIASVLSGGCQGFASNFMQWPEDLIVGGVSRNRSGQIVRASALQSVINLMDETSVYNFHDKSYTVHNVDWSVDKAREVIEAWQSKFTHEVLRLTKAKNSKQNFNVLSFHALTDIMKIFTKPNYNRVIIGGLITVLYVCGVLINYEKPELSQACVGFFGVLLVCLAIASAFGLCALLGLPFNATTTQILPFLSLGLGVNSIFLLTHTLNRIISASIVPLEEQTGECLKRTGVNIVLSNACLILAFAASSVIPLPALRYFSLQAAVSMSFTLLAVLILFPAVFSLDLKRRAVNRLDLFCCLKASQPEPEPRETRSESITKLMQTPPMSSRRLTETVSGTQDMAVISLDDNQLNEIRLKKQRGLDDGCFGISLSFFASKYLAPVLKNPLVRVLVVVTFLITWGVGVWGTVRLEDGLQLTDLIPKGTNEYQFLDSQQKYFAFYRIFTVTQANFEYPTSQKLLYDYHKAFNRVDKIIKNDNGGLPEFWLPVFREWLLGLQKTFDHEFELGYIKKEGWTEQASEEAILAYKLLVQTGRVDNPVEKVLVVTNRLVDRDGIITPKAFYNYLTAWYNYDPIGYASSQASIVPEPRYWNEPARSTELKIPKSSAIQYSQLPFYLHELQSTKDIIDTISQIRAICTEFEHRSLPNFPTGLPIIYWEQYIGLRFYLALALLLVLSCVFILTAAVLLNIWAALVIVLVLSCSVIQTLGVLHLLHLSLSAIPAVLIVISVGMGVDLCLHLTVAYLTSLGSRTKRVSMALEYMTAPMIHATITTLLAIGMLAFSEFDFVIRHFCYLLASIVGIYSFNGFVVLPVLLTLAGPPGELIPRNKASQIDPPSPQDSPVPQRRGRSSRSQSSSNHPLSSSSSRKSSRRPVLQRTHSDHSLSTITEEPTSYQNSDSEPAKIVVSPEITVETTTTTNTTNGFVSHISSLSGSPDATPSPTPSTLSNDSGTNSPTVVTTTDVTPNGTNVTTKVTTTAKVKVDLGTIGIPLVHPDMYRYRRPSSRRSCRGSCSSQDMSSNDYFRYK